MQQQAAVFPPNHKLGTDSLACNAGQTNHPARGAQARWGASTVSSFSNGGSLLESPPEELASCQDTLEALQQEGESQSAWSWWGLKPHPMKHHAQFDCSEPMFC